MRNYLDISGLLCCTEACNAAVLVFRVLIFNQNIKAV